MLSRYALSSCVAAAMLIGCGGSQPPIAPTGATAQSAVLQSQGKQRDDHESWMAPDAASQDLLYAGTLQTVTIYSYPRGRLEGVLSGFDITGGLCVDKSEDVYITDMYGYNAITEYAHGSKKPLRTFPRFGASPFGCSIDPTTGDLAVAGFSQQNTGAVAVYRNARRKPTLYKNPTFYEYYFCGYDNKGNLFVDGLSYPGESGDFALGEIAKGGTTLQTLSLTQSIGFPGQVQWDGKHVTVGDQSTPKIYQFDVQGSAAIEVGAISLKGHVNDVAQYWIQGHTLVAPAEGYGKMMNHYGILMYRYPAGGRPIKKISHTQYDLPNSSAVSLARRS
jgi:hypothetical protein